MKKLLLIVTLGLLSMQVTYAENYPGSYKQTCKGCYTRGHTLHCKCRKANQSWHWSSLVRPDRCNRIKNDNGWLTCAGGVQPSPQPAPPPQNKATQTRKEIRQGNWAPSDVLNG